MSQPVHDLQRLISTPRRIAGRVVSVSQRRIRVATDSGIVEASSSQPLEVGDAVVLERGIAYKSSGGGNAQVFQV